MSLTVDGVWKVGVWAETVWADGVWAEGGTPPPDGEVTRATFGGPPKVNIDGKIVGHEERWGEYLPRVEKAKEAFEEAFKDKEIAERMQAISETAPQVTPSLNSDTSSRNSAAEPASAVLSPEAFDRIRQSALKAYLDSIAVDIRRANEETARREALAAIQIAHEVRKHNQRKRAIVLLLLAE